MTQVLRLTLLEPSIVEAILAGRQGPAITVERVLERFRVEWEAQTSHFVSSADVQRTHRWKAKCGRFRGKPTCVRTCSTCRDGRFADFRRKPH